MVLSYLLLPCASILVSAIVEGMKEASKVKEEYIVSPETLFSDDRGEIEQMMGAHLQSVLRITSKAGSVRANHYHKQDSHTCYLESGKLRYVTRSVENEDEPLKEDIITPGQLFYTPPMLVHAMHFLEDSVFYVFTPRSGNSAEYENDIIKVVLVDPKEAMEAVK